MDRVGHPDARPRLGCRSKRLLPKETHKQLDDAQRVVVKDLDLWVDYLERKADMQAWGDFYVSLEGAKRRQIEDMLAGLSQHLEWAQRSRGIYLWRRTWGDTPPEIELAPGFVAGPPPQAQPGTGVPDTP